LALDSLDTEAPLPLALFAAPILDTLGDGRTDPIGHDSEAPDLRESLV
jgi:hypothetical protein